MVFGANFFLFFFFSPMRIWSNVNEIWVKRMKKTAYQLYCCNISIHLLTTRTKKPESLHSQYAFEFVFVFEFNQLNSPQANTFQFRFGLDLGLSNNRANSSTIFRKNYSSVDIWIAAVRSPKCHGVLKRWIRSGEMWKKTVPTVVLL